MAGKGLIGVIGGSGLYGMPELVVEDEIELDTPFGKPSDSFIRGNLGGVEVVFLARHARGHLVSAPYLNFRANIYGMKSLGVDALISVNAAGSMREDIHPKDIVIPDQFYDNTKGRVSSFFTGTPAVHVDVADPVCPVLGATLFAAGKKVGATVRDGGTYLCMEGPAFSTRAESKIYRGWGVDLIGMTVATEAKLAREAEICFTSLCCITDYDVWKETEEDVTIEMIVDNLSRSAENAKQMIASAIPGIHPDRPCGCREALTSAIISDPSTVSDDERRRLHVLLAKYLPPGSEVSR